MARRRNASGDGPHGVICLDKAAGPTSLTATRAAARAVGGGRAGHAGTLDPAATGVLVVLVGEATKLSHWIIGHDKRYRATVVFGATTDTLDAAGEVVATSEVPEGAVTAARLEAVFPPLLGEVEQTPPIYSALKRGGRTLMSRARAGEEVEVEPRRVRCDRLTVVSVDGPRAVIDVACGSGYYVRSLARDLGLALGFPAHLGALRRTRSGPFDIAEAVTLEELTPASVRPLADAVPGLLRVTLDPDEAVDIHHGRPIAARLPGERALLMTPDGVARALAERTPDDRWRVFRGFRYPAHDHVANPNS